MLQFFSRISLKYNLTRIMTHSLHVTRVLAWNPFFPFTIKWTWRTSEIIISGSRRDFLYEFI